MGARGGVREAAWTESKELKVVRSREMAVKLGRVGWTGGSWVEEQTELDV